MKKTYQAPDASSIAFDTEEILNISFTGNGEVLGEKNMADLSPSDEFGGIQIF